MHLGKGNASPGAQLLLQFAKLSNTGAGGGICHWRRAYDQGWCNHCRFGKQLVHLDSRLFRVGGLTAAGGRHIYHPSTKYQMWNHAGYEPVIKL